MDPRIPFNPFEGLNIGEKLLNYPIVKCSIVGNGRVGKSSICAHLEGKRISANYDLTVGVSILTHLLQVNGTTLKMLLYDLAGQPHFRCVRPAFYSGTKSAVVVFSLTDRGSFYDVKHWLRELQNCIGRVPLVLVGNKNDQKAKREVNPSEASAFARELGVPYFETSAKTGYNVKKVFETAAFLAIDEAAQVAVF